MKQPISYFLKKSYQSLLWEQRRYFDRALHGSQELNRDFNDANSQGKKIRNIEEGWYKRTKKKKEKENHSLGYYRSADTKNIKVFPSNNVSLESDLITKKAYNLFSTENWDKAVSKQDTPETCERKLKAKWNMLGFKEQNKFISAVTRTGNTKGMDQCIICNKEESPADSNLNYWFCCDLCSFWFHCECLGLHFREVEATSNHNCETCIKAKFLPFLRFLSYHTIETLNTNNHSNVGNLSSIWLAKLEEEKSVLLKYSFEEKQQIFNKTSVVTSNAGIENIFQNCWFNSIVQAVYGSSLFQYFNVKELHNDPVIVHINSIGKMLRDSNTSVTVVDQVGRIRDWTNLGTLLGMSLHEGEQRDLLEFNEALVNCVKFNEAK